MKKTRPACINIPDDNLNNKERLKKVSPKYSDEYTHGYESKCGQKYLYSSKRDVMAILSPGKRQLSRKSQNPQISPKNTCSKRIVAGKAMQKSKKQLDKIKESLTAKYFDFDQGNITKTEANNRNTKSLRQKKADTKESIAKDDDNRTLVKGFSVTPKVRSPITFDPTESLDRKSAGRLGYHRASSKELGNTRGKKSPHYIDKSKLYNDLQSIYKKLSHMGVILSPKYKSNDTNDFVVAKGVKGPNSALLTGIKNKLKAHSIRSDKEKRNMFVKRQNGLQQVGGLAKTSSNLGSPKANAKKFGLSSDQPKQHRDYIGSPTTKNTRKLRICLKEGKTVLNSPKSSVYSNIEKPVIDFTVVRDWRSFCGILRDLEHHLRQILNAIEKDETPYDPIRQYIDYIQYRGFDELLDIIINKKYKQIIKESIILERWVIFMILFMHLERILAENKYAILKMITLIYQNLVYYLKLIYLDRKNCASTETLIIYKAFLKQSILPQNVDFYRFEISKPELIKFIKNSVNSMKDFLIDCQSLNNARISRSITFLLSSELKAELDVNLDYLLDTFCDYFVAKGIVTIDYPEDEDKDTNDQTHCNSLATPFIRSPIDSREFTLILDLDETLVHFTQTVDGGQVLLRPHVHRFLHEMERYYEIVVFTAAQQDYADWIIDRLDPSGYITHRLYRQHTYCSENTNIKDLEKVGRDLKKTIIVDNIAENFQFHSDNGIYVKSWFNDPYDTVLLDLIPLLKG